jgi:hypothetical protein
MPARVADRCVPQSTAQHALHTHTHGPPQSTVPNPLNTDGPSAHSRTRAHDRHCPQVGRRVACRLDPRLGRSRTRRAHVPHTVAVCPREKLRPFCVPLGRVSVPPDTPSFSRPRVGQSMGCSVTCTATTSVYIRADPNIAHVPTKRECNQTLCKPNPHQSACAHSLKHLFDDCSTLCTHICTGFLLATTSMAGLTDGCWVAPTRMGSGTRTLRA